MAKLLIAIVHQDDAGGLVDALRRAEIRLTEASSRGGFLRSGSVMIYMGLEDEQVPEAMRLIEQNCTSRTVSVPAEALGGLEVNWLPAEVRFGGATVFVIPLEEIRRI